jgi:hypothetical protein
MIGLNDLGVEYEGLPGLGIITDKDSLKCVGQWPSVMQASATRTKRAVTSKEEHQCLRYAKFRAPLAGCPIGDFGSLHQGAFCPDY